MVKRRVMPHSCNLALNSLDESPPLLVIMQNLDSATCSILHGCSECPEGCWCIRLVFEEVDHPETSCIVHKDHKEAIAFRGTNWHWSTQVTVHNGQWDFRASGRLGNDAMLLACDAWLAYRVRRGGGIEFQACYNVSCNHPSQISVIEV